MGLLKTFYVNSFLWNESFMYKLFYGDLFFAFEYHCIYQLFWQFWQFWQFFIVNIWRHIWQITIRLIGIGIHFQSQRSPYLRMVWCKFWLTYCVYIWQYISIVRECIKNTKMAKKKKSIETEFLVQFLDGRLAAQ